MSSLNYRHVLCSLCVVAGLLATPWSAPAEPVFTSPAEAAANPDFAIQGEYTGPNVGVQVIALGKGSFSATIYKGGLPGAGWNERDRNEDENDAAGIQELVQSLKLKKVERSSPTLGLKAPAGSIVLFDGTPDSLQKHWKPGAKATPEGLLLPGCTSSQNYADFSLHIEFQLPFMPDARGQGRGNSGIYCQGRFETQMLDSFGLQGKDNECGGLYSIKAPDINMCLPPLSWQTYDLEFTASRWGEKGSVTAPRITVRHNGVVIHRDVELPQAATAAAAPGTVESGPILLQDHGNPVRYRNIWLVPRNAEREARRPFLPGFERFHANTSAVPADGGRLLLGELNCTACHQAEGAQAAGILPKQSPVLDDVGKRVQPEFLLSFLANPHAVKPGTTMPDLMSGLPAAERDKAILALVNFLVRTDTPGELSSEPAAVKRGKQLFHQIGCIACHAPDAETKAMPRGSIPLSDLKAKYTIPSLAGFLQEPHRVRPSARMPAFNLEKTEAVDLASYLIGDVNLRPRNANMTFAAYEGSWDKVPKFEELKPYKTGKSAGLDLAQAGREGNFGMRFTGFLKIERAGDYTFHIGSDDGSLLFIDGKKVADSDGIHPHTVQSGRTRLTAGLHPIQVDYTQGGGEWTLSLEFEGPGTPRQDAARAIVMTEKGNPPAPPPPQDAKPRFVFDPELVEQGRALFATVGCASCHQLKRDGKTIAGVPAKPLSKLDPTKGCLAVSRDATAAPSTDALQPGIGPRVPQFDLNFNQQTALAAAIAVPLAADSKPTATQSIAHTMAAFNCYACHSRDKIGGPERDRNALFVSAIPEMGDEGRVPPPLDGVGDKLNEDWMRHVLDNGARDRPYMLTRMPKFGGANVGHLTAAFVSSDQRTEAVIPKSDEPEIRSKASGRFLVGDKALACIKCHRFGENRATGIQALDLQTMTRRVREDWFFRYMVNPEVYRPGTRMPSAFIDGKVAVKDLYHGDPGRQLLAIWTFLKAGSQAAIPDGLIANIIELKPEGRPILYRNFLEGLTPRGIAVGYPEKGHLAWDANNFSLTLLWHGRFIDAGKHWEGRGPGNQGPLGDHVVRFEETAPFARLESTGPNVPWPAQPPKERGYHFQGYSLDPQGRPHFRYQTPDFSVVDYPQPIPQGAEGSFKRQLTVTSSKPVDDLYFRAAAGQSVEALADGWYLINGVTRVRITGTPGQPALRKSGALMELLVPVKFVAGKAEIVQEIAW